MFSSKTRFIIILVCAGIITGIILYGRYNGAQARKFREERNALLTSKNYSSPNIWNNDNRKPIVVAYPKINKPTTKTKTDNMIVTSIENFVSWSVKCLKQIPWKKYAEQAVVLIEENTTNSHSRQIIPIVLSKSLKQNTHVVQDKPVLRTKTVPPVIVPIQYVSPSPTYRHQDVDYCPPVPRANSQYTIVSYNR